MKTSEFLTCSTFSFISLTHVHLWSESIFQFCVFKLSLTHSVVIGSFNSVFTFFTCTPVFSIDAIRSQFHTLWINFSYDQTVRMRTGEWLIRWYDNVLDKWISMQSDIAMICRRIFNNDLSYDTCAFEKLFTLSHSVTRVPYTQYINDVTTKCLRFLEFKLWGLKLVVVMMITHCSRMFFEL